MPRIIRAGAIQQKGFKDKAQSLKYTEQAIAQLAGENVDLVVCQELHATEYFCQQEDLQNFDLAEPIPGPTSEHLSKLARTHNCVIVGSIFEQRAPGLYHNTAVVFDRDGSLCGSYRKMHIPDDPGFYEKFYFTPGDADPENLNGFTPIETSIGKLGVLVCWDQWFPEAARLMTLAGADLLIYPTAIGWDRSDNEQTRNNQLQAWITIQRSHAVANGLPVIVANRCGFEASPVAGDPGIDFWGNSFICGPQGEMLNHADHQQAHNLMAEIDLDQSRAIRQIWPYLRDRRVDAYSGLLRRYID